MQGRSVGERVRHTFVHVYVIQSTRKELEAERLIGTCETRVIIGDLYHLRNYLSIIFTPFRVSSTTHYTSDTTRHAA